MADKKVTEFPELTEIALGDIGMVVDISEPLDINKTKRIIYTNIIASLKRLLATGETPGTSLKVNSDANGLEFEFGGMTLIEEKLLAAPAANIDFSAIPDTFTHLKLLIEARGTAAAVEISTRIIFNGDSGVNYDYEYFKVSALSPGSLEYFGESNIIIGMIAAANAAAGLSGSIETSFPNYKGISFNKTLLSGSSHKTGTTTGKVILTRIAGFWRDSSAINQITIFPGTNNFAAGSIASLYGMR